MNSTLLICGCKSYLHEQQTSDKLLWWIHQHPCLEHPKALGSHQQIRNPWGTDQTRACNLGCNPLLHKASWLFKATSFQIMGYGWLWFVAIHSRGNHSHILLLFLPTKGHLWRQSVNFKSSTIQIAAPSNMFQSHSYSSQIWRPLTFHQTLIDISWVQKKHRVPHLRVKRPTWYACYVFLYFIFRLSMKTMKETACKQPMVPGSLETPSKRDMLADPNCLRWWNHWISRPSAATTSHNWAKEWLLVWKGPLFMTLHVDTVKAQDGRRHQRFEKNGNNAQGADTPSEARDKWHRHQRCETNEERQPTKLT